MTRYTPTEIEARLDEAARTMRRMPPAKRPRLSMMSLPIVHDRNEAFGYTELDAEEVQRRIRPDARAISEMEEALEWLMLIPNQDHRRIVWLRATGLRWKPIYIEFGMSRATAHRHWMTAIYTIQKAVNKQTVKPAAKVRARVIPPLAL